MGEIKIEKGIPIPSSYVARAKYPFREMAVGDSFLVPRTVKTNNLYGYARSIGIRIGVRTEGDNYRVWRIE